MKFLYHTGFEGITNFLTIIIILSKRIITKCKTSMIPYCVIVLTRCHF